jgi:hypothetical protein
MPEGGFARATCVNHCLDDNDPEPVDCARAEEGVEFHPTPVWDFEIGASNLYGYSDGSPDFFRSVSGRAQDGTVEFDPLGKRLLGFEPPTRDDVPRCIGEEPGSNSVIHVQGGPFRAWGGAIGRHLKCLNSNRDSGSVYATGELSITYNADGQADELNKGCSINDTGRVCDADVTSPAYTACPERDRPGAVVPPGEEFMLGMTLDLTAWDGISFWARRTNDSQPGIRVALGDKHTDDDLSYLQYHINPNDKRFCERNQECGCPGGKECVNGACMDPRYDPALEEGIVSMQDSVVPGVAAFPVLNEDNAEGYAPCGQYVCERGFRAFRSAGGNQPREDVPFKGTQCTPFTFRGGITDNFCYDPSGELPYENSHLCGDHWLKSVHLSTKWQFYKVPFTQLIQQGWAKEAYSLDLTSSAIIRFIWGRGWVDMMFDDVRFYRNKNTKE